MSASTRSVPRGGGALHGVEDDRARVAALGAPHEVGAGPLGPRLELLGGGGAERVPRRHDHAAALVGLSLADLADGGGLAHAVHADEQPHVRRPRLEGQGAVAPAEVVLELVLQGLEQRRRVPRSNAPPPWPAGARGCRWSWPHRHRPGSAPPRGRPTSPRRSCRGRGPNRRSRTWCCEPDRAGPGRWPWAGPVLALAPVPVRARGAPPARGSVPAPSRRAARAAGAPAEAGRGGAGGGSSVVPAPRRPLTNTAPAPRRTTSTTTMSSSSMASRSVEAPLE